MICMGIALVLMLGQFCVWCCCGRKIGHIYVGMQKDELIVHYRLREVLARERCLPERRKKAKLT